MAIAPVGSAHAPGTNVSSVNVNYTVASTSNLLVFAVAIDNFTTATITVDDNGGGHSAVQQGGYATNAQQRVAIFTMTPPAAGTLTFRATSSEASQDINLHVEEYSGVGSIGNTATATGSTDPMNVSVTMQDANNYVVGAFGSRGTAAPTTGNPGTFRSGEFSNAVDREASALADNTSASTGSLNVGVTIPGGGLGWAAVGLELRSGGTVSAALTGTALASITEADIVAGGKTIVITLTGDSFIPS
jgi:hypothetical protein